MTIDSGVHEWSTLVEGENPDFDLSKASENDTTHEPSQMPAYIKCVAKAGGIVFLGLLGAAAARTVESCVKNPLACGSVVLSAGAILGKKLGIRNEGRVAVAGVSLALGLIAAKDSVEPIPQLTNGSI